MSLNTRAYISVLVHEFWHATVQVEGTANLTNREGEAFGIQAMVLEELDGDPQAIAYLKSISKDPTSVGYNDDILKEARGCLGILLALGPFGDNATWQRWIEVKNRLEE